MATWLAVLLSVLSWLLKNCWQFLLGIAVVVALLIWWQMRGCDNDPDEPDLAKYKAKIETVELGDQLVVYKSAMSRPRLHLAFVGCPKLDQVYGDESKAALEKLLTKNLVVEVEEVTKTEQIVWTLDRINACTRQLEAGAAWCKAGAPSAWTKIEKEARLAGRGLWQYYSGPNILKPERTR